MVGIGLLKFLKGNSESLKLPPVLESALKRLESFLFLINTKTDGADKNGSEIITDQRRRKCKRIRSGFKNIEGRVRNEISKIKQLITVPKNVQVKKTDRLFEE